MIPSDSVRLVDCIVRTFPAPQGRYLVERGKRPRWAGAHWTKATVLAHVNGTQRIGFPFDPERLTFAAFDLDGKKHPEGREWALATALRIVRALAALGIGAILEQSRSGKGFHVWILYDEDGPRLADAREFASAVLRTLGLPDSFSEAQGVPGFYPWPPKTKDCGRVPYLPLFGVTNGHASGLLCDLETGEPFTDQLAALQSVERTPAGVFIAALETVRGVAPAPPKPRRPKAQPRPFTGELSLFAETALTEEAARVASAAPDTRHPTLYSAARNLGELIAGGELPRPLVESSLADAAATAGLVGLRAKEVERTIADGIEKGLTNPRRGDFPSTTTARPTEAPEEPSPPAKESQGQPPFIKRDEASAALAQLVATFRKWQYLPDPRGLYAVLAAYVANLQPGEPLWLLVVAPSGKGKTELLATLTEQPHVHRISTLTEASLLSGTPQKERAKDASGGLLRQVGTFGILLAKDFTSVLAMNKDKRGELLGALREVYDGQWTRHVGADGGKELTWEGRVGFIGACTPAIDEHHAVMAAMGERFVLFRLPDVDGRELGRAALNHAGSPAQMRRELKDSVQSLLARVGARVAPRELTSAENERIVALATFAASARSPVTRNSYTREIEQVPGEEAPTRLAISLRGMLGGLQAIGASDDEAWSTIRKIAMDCVPTTRRRVLDLLRENETLPTPEITSRLRLPATTAKRALEDLHAYDLLGRQGAIHDGGKNMAENWSLSARALDLIRGFGDSETPVGAGDASTPSSFWDKDLRRISESPDGSTPRAFSDPAPSSPAADGRL